MKIKKLVVAVILVGALSTASAVLADSVNRCMNLISKRVNTDTLNLAECDLTPANAPTILSFLNEHPDIKSLILNDNPKFGGAGAAIVLQATSLEVISVTNTKFGKEGFAAVAKSTTLKKVIINSWHDDAELYTWLDSLKGNASLTSIDFSHVPYFTDDNVKILTTIPTLEEINLNDAQLDTTTKAVLAMNSLPNLKKLHLRGKCSSDDTLALLAANPSLTELEIGCRLSFDTPPGLKALTAISNSASLQSVGLTVRRGSLPALSALKDNLHITSFDINAPLDDNTVAIIASMKNLTKLTMWFDGDADYTLPTNINLIAQLPKLKLLEIYVSIDAPDYYLDTNTIAALASNHTITDLTLTRVTNTDAALFAKNTTLERLTINNYVANSDSNQAKMALLLQDSLGLLAKISSLKELYYKGNFDITAAVADNLISNQSLQAFSATDGSEMARINKKALETLSQTTNLRSLNLQSNNIKEADGINFANNKFLRHLNLSTENIKNMGIVAFADNATLDELILNLNKISPAAYNTLMRNENISTINVYFNFDDK